MKTENTENRAQEIDLRVLLGDILGIVRRLWPMAIVLMLAVSAVLCLRAHHSYVPMYRASSTFTVYVANPLQSEVRGYNAATAEQMATTFPYILTSGALQDLVKKDLGLPATPPISASVMPNTNIFTLSVTSADPQLAYDVLNSVIAHYPDIAEFVVGPTVMNLLDESGVPQAPYNRQYYTGAIKKGALIGLAAWAALVILLAMTRSTVHNEDELARLINIHCIATLPRVKWDRRSNTGRCPLVDKKNSDISFSEAVRLLRIRTEKELQQRGLQVLLVSSATPGEGKTTVALNLAKSLTDKGKRVLLVDCDLRNPSIAKNLGLENQAGLSDVLAGRLSPEKALHQVEDTSLFLTFAGSPTDQAAELLSRPESRQYMDACRKTFDYIILDTPPSSLLADAAEIAHVADAALLVIRQNFAAKSKILEGAQTLAEGGLELVGCVMNCTTHSALSGYGGYYGKYGDHYSHYYYTQGAEKEN